MRNDTLATLSSDLGMKDRLTEDDFRDSVKALTLAGPDATFRAALKTP